MSPCQSSRARAAPCSPNEKSGSSKNKIELEEIEEVLNAKGETKKFAKDYRFFNAGKTDLDNHQELLYITKVK